MTSPWFFSPDINEVLEEQYSQLVVRHDNVGVRVYSDFGQAGDPGSYTFVALRTSHSRITAWPQAVFRRGPIYLIPADAPRDREKRADPTFAVPVEHTAYYVLDAVTVHCHSLLDDPGGYGFKVEKWFPETRLWVDQVE